MRSCCAAVVAWRMLLAVVLWAVLRVLLLGLGRVGSTSSSRMRGCVDTAAASAAASLAFSVKEGLRAAAMADESSALTAKQPEEALAW